MHALDDAAVVLVVGVVVVVPVVLLVVAPALEVVVSVPPARRDDRARAGEHRQCAPARDRLARDQLEIVRKPAIMVVDVPRVRREPWGGGPRRPVRYRRGGLPADFAGLAKM